MGILSAAAAAGICAVAADAAPLVAERIVRRAAANLHPDIRDACEEEWLADIDRRPTGVAKLRAAITLYFGALQLPQFDLEEAAQVVEEGVIFDGRTIRIVLRIGSEKHEYELEGDPTMAATMLRRNGHERAANLLDGVVENEAASGLSAGDRTGEEGSDEKP